MKTVKKPFSIIKKSLRTSIHVFYPVMPGVHIFRVELGIEILCEFYSNTPIFHPMREI